MAQQRSNLELNELNENQMALKPSYTNVFKHQTEKVHLQNGFKLFDYEGKRFIMDNRSLKLTIATV